MIKRAVIKCVIWDLDNTLFNGVYLESPDQQPPAKPKATTVLTELAGRGILQAIASRNPPEAAAYATELTGHSFASVQCGWGAKSAAVTAVLTELGLEPQEAAFVDDDAMERAEVSFRLPDVLVLDPNDLAEIPSWPQFSPPVVTEEGRRRGEFYLQRQARQAQAKAFGGSVAEFLRQAGTQVKIAPAGQQDAARLAELSVRTHQFNSAGRQVSQEAFADLIRQAGRRVITVRLSDKFGDDGLVGGCVIETEPGSTWRVPLLMMSCRAIGRGVIDTLLAWIGLTARGDGAAAVIVPCVINDRNVPLRIALTGAGFRAGDRPQPGRDRSVDYERPLAQAPAGPARLGGHPMTTNPTAAELRQLLAELTSDDRALTAPDGTPLLREGLGLDSLGGALLLRQVRARFGVDVADEDLNLDCLATIGTLTAFIAIRRNSR